MGSNHGKLTYLGMPKGVYVMAFAQVVNSMGNFVFPFMTLLLTTKMGMNEKEAGFFLLLGFLIRLPGSVFGGRLADKVGRKKIIIIFMALAACCYIPCAFFVGMPSAYRYIPWLLIVSSFFQSMSMPPSGAMVNDLTVPETRQAASSLLYMGMNVGLAIGSMIAGFLFNHNMKLLFIGDAFSTLVSIILITVHVKETKPTHEEIQQIGQERAKEMGEKGSFMSALLHRPALIAFAIFDTIFAFAYTQTGFSIPLQANAIFGEGSGPELYGTIVSINCLEVILLTTILTLCTRKLRAIFNISIAGIFFAIGFGMLFFATSFWMFALSTFIWTIGEIIHATNNGVYLANHTPASHRGRFNAFQNIITNSGAAVSPYIMGAYIAGNGVSSVWPIIFILCVITSAAMLILGIVEKKRESRMLESEA